METFSPHIKEKRFVNMEPIGYSDAVRQPLSEEGTIPQQSPIYRDYKIRNNLKDTIIDELTDVGKSGFSEEKYYASLKKCDKLPVKPDNDELRLAVEFTKRQLNFLKGSRITNQFDVNWDTISGIPYNHFGMGKKSDFQKSIDSLYILMAEKYDPIWKVSPKKEFLRKTDLDDGKLRTFFIPPIDFLFWQKTFWTEMDKKLASASHKCYSKYGWVKQYSGFDKLQSRLERFMLKFMLDVSGYDRALSLMDEVYDVRLSMLSESVKNSPKLMKILEWVIENTIRPIIGLTDGTIWRRLCGNGSGSNETTTDNTIAHIILMFYLLIKLFVRRFGKMPTYEELEDKAEIFLYGDDNEGGIDSDFFDIEPEEFEKFVRNVYGEFGLIIKESAFKMEVGKGRLFDLEFLGSSTRWNEKYARYVPYPRVEKVLGTLKYVLEKNETTEQVASKIIAMYVLFRPNEDEQSGKIVNFLRSYSEFVLREYYDSTCSRHMHFLNQVADDSYPWADEVFGLESAGILQF